MRMPNAQAIVRMPDADVWEGPDVRFREIGREIYRLLAMLDHLFATDAHLPPFFAELRVCCLGLRDAWEDEEHIRRMDRRRIRSMRRLSILLRLERRFS